MVKGREEGETLMNTNWLEVENNKIYKMRKSPQSRTRFRFFQQLYILASHTDIKMKREELRFEKKWRDSNVEEII